MGFTDMDLAGAGKTNYSSTNRAQETVAGDRVIDITSGRYSGGLELIGVDK